MSFETENKKIKIVLADDHEIFRAGIKRFISVDPDFIIDDEAANGEDALEHVRYYKPDIALLDILMPRMSGIEAARVIKKEMPEVMVVILTAYEDSAHLDSALEAGADGYLTKDINSKGLLEALHNVMNGERVFSRTILKILQKKYVSYDRQENDQVTISKREQIVLNYIARGKTSREIADILSISLRTVQSHRANIMQKLEIKTLASLVRYAVLNYDRPTGSVACD